MIVKPQEIVKKYLRRWFKKCMARYLFRSEELPIFVGYGQLNYICNIGNRI